jgi:hypothetical protein
MLPSPYVIGTTGIYDDESYQLTFNENKTFSRKLVFPGQSNYTDQGTWEINDNKLILNSELSLDNEQYTLHSNSGTSLALYQVQTWLLLPDAVTDTLDADYYENNAEMIYDKYADDIELKMYYFFKKEN